VGSEEGPDLADGEMGWAGWDGRLDVELRGGGWGGEGWGRVGEGASWGGRVLAIGGLGVEHLGDLRRDQGRRESRGLRCQR
jgi:hypothetical protein